MEVPFAEYITSLWKYFEALIPGGVFAIHEIAVRAIPQYQKWVEARMSFTWRVVTFIVLAFGGLILASYWVWLDERSSHAETSRKLQTELQDHRATIHFEPGRIWHVTGLGKIEAYAAVINVGPGVAKIEEWGFGLNVLDIEVGNSAENIVELGDLVPHYGTPDLLPNRSTIKIKRTGPQLSPDDAAALHAQSKRIYLFGRIRFHDANGEGYEFFPCVMFSGEHAEIRGHPDKLYEAWQKDPCPGSAFNKTRKLNVTR